MVVCDSWALGPREVGISSVIVELRLLRAGRIAS